MSICFAILQWTYVTPIGYICDITGLLNISDYIINVAFRNIVGFFHSVARIIYPAFFNNIIGQVTFGASSTYWSGNTCWIPAWYQGMIVGLVVVSGTRIVPTAAVCCPPEKCDTWRLVPRSREPWGPQASNASATLRGVVGEYPTRSDAPMW